MADQVFNIAKGRGVEFYNRVKSNDPANAALILVLFQVSESDETLIDYADLAAIIAGANTEADFTNYARIVLTDAELDALPPPDNTNNRYDIDMPDQEYINAGGALNNTLTKIIVCYDADTTTSTDADIIPMAHYDFVYTTTGIKINLRVNEFGFYRAI